MVKITIVCVGKIKEKFYRDALDEYSKRLGKYCKFQVVEVSDEPTPDRALPSEEEIIKSKEGKKILSKIPDNAYVCTLEILGDELSSTELASEIDRLTTMGKSSIAFVIGGSLGLSEEVTKRSDRHLSFSKMTFPHQLMRVILSEQIYRSFRIINNEPYHK